MKKVIFLVLGAVFLQGCASGPTAQQIAHVNQLQFEAEKSAMEARHAQRQLEAAAKAAGIKVNSPESQNQEDGGLLGKAVKFGLKTMLPIPLP